MNALDSCVLEAHELMTDGGLGLPTAARLAEFLADLEQLAARARDIAPTPYSLRPMRKLIEMRRGLDAIEALRRAVQDLDHARTDLIRLRAALPLN